MNIRWPVSIFQPVNVKTCDLLWWLKTFAAGAACSFSKIVCSQIFSSTTIFLVTVWPLHRITSMKMMTDPHMQAPVTGHLNPKSVRCTISTIHMFYRIIALLPAVCKACAYWCFKMMRFWDFPWNVGQVPTVSSSSISERLIPGLFWEICCPTLCSHQIWMTWHCGRSSSISPSLQKERNEKTSTL